MRVNGLLHFETVKDGGLNEFGEVLAPTACWSEPIPCSIKTINDKIGVYEDGEFRQASFSVLIELASFPYKRVKLQRYDEELGEYRVISIEPLVSVGRTKILV